MRRPFLHEPSSLLTFAHATVAVVYMSERTSLVNDRQIGRVDADIFIEVCKVLPIPSNYNGDNISLFGLGSMPNHPPCVVVKTSL